MNIEFLTLIKALGKTDCFTYFLTEQYDHGSINTRFSLIQVLKPKCFLKPGISLNNGETDEILITSGGS